MKTSRIPGFRHHLFSTPKSTTGAQENSLVTVLAECACVHALRRALGRSLVFVVRQHIDAMTACGTDTNQKAGQPFKRSNAPLHCGILGEAIPQGLNEDSYHTINQGGSRRPSTCHLATLEGYTSSLPSCNSEGSHIQTENCSDTELLHRPSGNGGCPLL